jgi:hypothetical protein
MQQQQQQQQRPIAMELHCHMFQLHDLPAWQATTTCSLPHTSPCMCWQQQCHADENLCKKHMSTAQEFRLSLTPHPSSCQNNIVTFNIMFMQAASPTPHLACAGSSSANTSLID